MQLDRTRLFAVGLIAVCVLGSGQEYGWRGCRRRLGTAVCRGSEDRSGGAAGRRKAQASQ
jgi:hypothetical protein